MYQGAFERPAEPGSAGGSSRPVVFALARYPMIIEPLASADEALPLLMECRLPVSDISATSARFFGARSGGNLVGVVGLEAYPPFALLRSLAVAPAFRSSGLARDMVGFVESLAASSGIDALYLLTTTAEKFFLNLGYSPADRAAAPPAIRGTSQFSGLCPASSSFLCKSGISGREAGRLPGE